MATFVEEGVYVSYPCWKVGGGTLLSIDGEDLLVRGRSIEWRDGSMEDCIGMLLPGDLLEEWSRDSGYIALSKSARQVYVDIMSGGNGLYSDRDMSEVVLAEHNRLMRSVGYPWMTWARLSEMARIVGSAVAVYPGLERRAELLASVSGIEHTAGTVESWNGETGLCDTCELAVRSCTESTDGKYVRDSYLSGVGLYDATFTLDRVGRSELAGLAKHWDSSVLTRYVVETGDIWRVVSAGEFIRAYASKRVGSAVSKEAFLEWVRAGH